MRRALTPTHLWVTRRADTPPRMRWWRLPPPISCLWQRWRWMVHMAMDNKDSGAAARKSMVRMQRLPNHLLLIPHLFPPPFGCLTCWILVRGHSRCPREIRHIKPSEPINRRKCWWQCHGTFCIDGWQCRIYRLLCNFDGSNAMWQSSKSWFWIAKNQLNLSSDLNKTYGKLIMACKFWPWWFAKT